MIKILKSSEKGFIQNSEIEKNCWVNVSNPGTDELNKLSADSGIPLDFLTDSLDVDERSRIEIENDLILTIIRVPRYDKDKLDVPFTTLPVGIAITKDIIITICSSDIGEILEFYNTAYVISDEQIDDICIFGVKI